MTAQVQIPKLCEVDGCRNPPKFQVTFKEYKEVDYVCGDCLESEDEKGNKIWKDTADSIVTLEALN